MEKRIHKIVSKGSYKNIPYIIIKNGIKATGGDKDITMLWYCSYIIPSENMKKYDPYNLDVQPHGGITFSGMLSGVPVKDKVWGWDYNHLDDQVSDFDIYKTKLGVMNDDDAIEILISEIKEYIGGLIDEIGY